MSKIRANGIDFEYERSGPVDGEPLLLIHGVGAQLSQWSPEYIGGFEAAGFSVIRFDPRDIGLSTHLDHLGVPDVGGLLAAHARGEVADIPYRITDLADDAAGLLDALGVASAHIMGVSLGGVVTQHLAIRHPEKVRSITIVMSLSGNPAYPPASPDILTKAAPDPFADEEGYVASSIEKVQALGSPRYPTDVERLRQSILATVRRSYHPVGFLRQFLTGRTAPDARPGLQQLTVPAIVIHGTNDPLIPVSCGEDIAANIPGSFLVKIDGMGHDCPVELADTFASLVALNARRTHVRH